MSNKFKKGDWCFCEFKLNQIEDMDGERITGVVDGMFSHGGYNLSDRCYPLELSVKKISDSVSYWSDRFHRLQNNSLNHPDLHRKLVEIWVEMCESRNDEENLLSHYNKLNDFGKAVCNLVEETRREVVAGVKIFSR